MDAAWIDDDQYLIRIGFVPISAPAGPDTCSAGKGWEVVRARPYRGDVAGVTTVVALRRWDYSGDVAWASVNHS